MISDSELPNTSRRPPRKSVYVSAVDWWIALLLAAGPFGCAGLTGLMLQQGRGDEAMICLIASATTLAITALFTIPCRYTILSDTLSIRCGVLFIRVPLNQIQGIEPSGSWLSAPALSLKRVKVSTSSRFYLVSPAERDRFVDELTQAVKESIAADEDQES